MDWDSLDIGQSENSPTTQTGDLPNKVTHHQEKDKHKREKHSGENKSLVPSYIYGILISCNIVFKYIQSYTTYNSTEYFEPNQTNI